MSCCMPEPISPSSTPQQGIIPATKSEPPPTLAISPAPSIQDYSAHTAAPKESETERVHAQLSEKERENVVCPPTDSTEPETLSAGGILTSVKLPSTTDMFETQIKPLTTLYRQQTKKPFPFTFAQVVSGDWRYFLYTNAKLLTFFDDLTISSITANPIEAHERVAPVAPALSHVATPQCTAITAPCNDTPIALHAAAPLNPSSAVPFSQHTNSDLVPQIITPADPQAAELLGQQGVTRAELPLGISQVVTPATLEVLDEPTLSTTTATINISPVLTATGEPLEPLTYNKCQRNSDTTSFSSVDATVLTLKKDDVKIIPKRPEIPEIKNEDTRQDRTEVSTLCMQKNLLVSTKCSQVSLGTTSGIKTAKPCGATPVETQAQDIKRTIRPQPTTSFTLRPADQMGPSTKRTAITISAAEARNSDLNKCSHNLEFMPGTSKETTLSTSKTHSLRMNRTTDRKFEQPKGLKKGDSGTKRNCLDISARQVASTQQDTQCLTKIPLASKYMKTTIKIVEPSGAKKSKLAKQCSKIRTLEAQSTSSSVKIQDSRVGSSAIQTMSTSAASISSQQTVGTYLKMVIKGLPINTTVEKLEKELYDLRYVPESVQYIRPGKGRTSLFSAMFRRTTTLSIYATDLLCKPDINIEAQMEKAKPKQRYLCPEIGNSCFWHRQAVEACQQEYGPRAYLHLKGEPAKFTKNAWAYSNYLSCILFKGKERNKRTGASALTALPPTMRIPMAGPSQNGLMAAVNNPRERGSSSRGKKLKKKKAKSSNPFPQVSATAKRLLETEQRDKTKIDETTYATITVLTGAIDTLEVTLVRIQEDPNAAKSVILDGIAELNFALQYIMAQGNGLAPKPLLQDSNS